MNNRRNIPVQKPITRELIDALPDKELPSVLWDYIWFKVGKNYKRLSQILGTLPQGFRVIYYLFILDAEIANGGFNQYFFNGLDETAELQSEALKRIGARKHQRIFRKAYRLRVKEKENHELQRLYVERSLEAFSKTYRLTGLGNCDQEWYALDDEFQKLIVKFIRRHTGLFVESESDL